MRAVLGLLLYIAGALLLLVGVAKLNILFVLPWPPDPMGGLLALGGILMMLLGLAVGSSRRDDSG
jgi:hypothetical protein